MPDKRVTAAVIGAPIDAISWGGASGMPLCIRLVVRT